MNDLKKMLAAVKDNPWIVFSENEDDAPFCFFCLAMKGRSHRPYCTWLKDQQHARDQTEDPTKAQAGTIMVCPFCGATTPTKARTMAYWDKKVLTGYCGECPMGYVITFELKVWHQDRGRTISGFEAGRVKLHPDGVHIETICPVCKLANVVRVEIVTLGKFNLTTECLHCETEYQGRLLARFSLVILEPEMQSIEDHFA